MNVKEFRGGYDSNFAYLVWRDKDAVLIDTAITKSRIFTFLEDKGLNLKAVFILHAHHDHLVSIEDYRERGIRIFGFESTEVAVDRRVKDGEIIEIDKMKFHIIHTPGHMSDSICILVDKKLFTSDTLFVGAIGRCDLDGANAVDYYDSLYKKILKLDDDVEIYPGHDYGKKRISTIKEEKENNKFLQCKSQQEFLELVGFY